MAASTSPARIAAIAAPIATAPEAQELAVERIGPVQAAQCTQQIERAGGNGVLYWASPASIEKMLDTPVGEALRPRNPD